MPGPFDTVLDEEEARLKAAPASTATGGTSKYDGVLDEEQTQTTTRLQASLRQAVGVNPDKVAKQTAIAASTGVPVPTVERNEEQATAMARVRDIFSIARTNPILARQLTDPEFAKLAHDDAEGLGAVEQAFGYIKKGGAALGASVPRANAALWAGGEAVADVVSKYITGPLAGTVLPADPAKAASEKFRTARLEQEGFAKDLRRNEGKGFIEQSVYGGIESLGQNLLMMPTALATGNPNMALLPMSAQTGGQEYAKAKDAGKPLLDALAYASSQAVIEYATEKLPVSKLLGDLKAGTPFWKMVTGQAVREIPGEQLATVLQDLNEWAVLKPNAPFSEYLAERPSAAASTLIATVISVGGQTTVAKGIEMAASKLGGGLHAAGEAERSQVFFDQLAKLAAASKLRERAPDSFGEFVQNASEDGPVTEVYVSGRELAQVLAQSPLVPVPESVKAQMDEAIKTGGDVRIPIGEYTAHLAASDVGPALLPHLKTTPEAMSFQEAQTFYQEQAGAFKQQAEQILAGQHQDLEAQNAAEAVKQHFVQQLGTANRFTPEVNNAYASLMRDFYVTTAQRLGITPQEMLQRYPLQVAAERAVNDAVLYQGQGYAKVPDSLMGFRKKGPQKGWDDQKYKFVQPVRVTFSDGQTFVDAEKGLNSKHAIERAHRNWEGAQIDAITEQEAVASDPQFTLDQKHPKGWETAQTSDPSSPDALKPGIGSRGTISFGKDITKGSLISLLQNADLSTFLHEGGHFYLEVLTHIASQPEAPAAIVEDVNAVLKWFGVKGAEAAGPKGGKVHLSPLEVWRGMSLEEKRPLHEKFARGFEAYLFEGQSPNVETQGLFNRFRAWLKNVYKSLSELNVELSDEVRGVFNRLLASDQEIASAEGLRQMHPMFASAAEANATAAEWQAYQELGQESTDTAVRQFERRSLADMKWAQAARGRYLKALQAESDEKRAAIRKEVEVEVGLMPIYQVLRFLRTGGVIDGKRTNVERKILEQSSMEGHRLNLDALKRMYGDGPAAPWRYLMEGRGNITTAQGGLQADTVAELFGFSSGDELVRKILEAEPEASVVQGMTDQRMLERHGDLVDAKDIEAAADKAVHNDARVRFVATEFRFLNRIANARQPTGDMDKNGHPISVNILARAAKQFAAQVIGRKKITDIRPQQYAAAEIRAAKAAAKATNPLEKATEKKNQLVNLHASRAAAEAIAEIEKAVRYLKRFDSEGTRKNLDVEYLDQIDQLLERFDMRQASQKEIAKRASLSEWIEEQRAAGYEPTIDKALEREAQRQHYSQITLDEFRRLVDAVKNIEHLGRLKKKLLTAKDDREFKVRVAEAVASIHDNATGTVTPQKSSDRGLLVPLGRLFRGFTAMHRKFSSLMREFDGFKDGGAMWELFSRTMNEAGDKEAVMREQATVKFAELFAPVLKEGNLGQKTFIPLVQRSFTREERLGIALNMGNTINRKRVEEGEQWTPAQLEAVLDTLTKDEWTFVQSVWNYLESFRPQIAEKTRRVTGTEPLWVDAEPVMTKHGNFRGGYYPIKYDPLADSRSEADDAASIQRQMERGLYVRAQTRRGHLEARVESTGRQLRYDLGVAMGHVDQVIHDLSWHEWLIDANRLLGAKSIDAAIREHYGPEKLGQLKNALKDIAVGDIPAQNSWEKVLNHLRTGATIVGLGWNAVTSLLQPLGLTQSMVRVGPVWVAKGLGRWLGDAARLENSTKEIYAKSSFMRLRAKTMQREINEIRNKVSGKDSALEASYFWLIQTMQKVADIPTWLGSYEKAMAQANMTEDRAIALADQAVIDAQGAGTIKDLAGIQKGGPGLKLFTNFYSFFNTTYNLAVEQTKATNFKNPLDIGKLAIDYLLLLVVPALLGALMKEAFKWGEKKEDELAKRLAREQINYIFGMMVGLREMGAAVQGFTGYGGPAGTRFFSETAKLAKQVEQGEVDEAAIKAAANTAGILLHLPTGQVTRSVDGILALSKGKTQNPGALLVGSDKN